MRRRLIAGFLVLAFPIIVIAQVVNPSGGGTTLPAADTTAIVKGSADATKLLKFEVDGFTAGTTRTITVPNVTDTMAVLGAQTFSGLQTFGAGISMNVIAAITIGNDNYFNLNAERILESSVQTRLELQLEPSNAQGNAVLIIEKEDQAFNFAHAQQPDPTIFVQSHNQSTSQWLGLAHNGTDSVLSNGAGDLKLTEAAGHVKMTGTAPAVSACGTSPSVATGSDHAGKVTWGTATPASCTLTFAVAYSAAPACVCNDETGILPCQAISTTTTLVMNETLGANSHVVSYLCLQGS